MMMDLMEDIAYIATLDQFKGIGPQSILRIIKVFPSIDLLQQASSTQLEEKLGKRLVAPVLSHLERWNELHEVALKGLNISHEKGIQAIPITSEAYPPLLKLIDDPPPILYAKGDISLLKHFHAVAIVGTREPTERGRETAYAFAQRWARHDYVVVAGLAKGIDTAAHQGTLDAQGKTIAVLGTPLDKIYPAENKGLAQRIVENGGLLLSEWMIGQAAFKTAFVARDRLQSGLSLCVFPVQTSIDGGTMHTVRFAEKQKRLMICLRPAPEEASAKQYEGIWSLIHEKKRALDPTREESYERCQHLFSLLLQKLSQDMAGLLRGEQETTQSPGEQRSITGLWDALDGAVSRWRSTAEEARNDRQIRQALEAFGINSQTEQFRTEVYHLRTLFNQGQTIAQALETVSNKKLQQELTPFMYCVELSALVTAARKLHMLSSEQAEDFQAFLKQIAGIVE
ncbi:MAG TPA: DNA-processing protein DprA [Ktedonobacteraceae bacterium]|nr:DNA-processing protein DprA [Ktedonobacteraceae bacterium]